MANTDTYSRVNELLKGNPLAAKYGFPRSAPEQGPGLDISSFTTPLTPRVSEPDLSEPDSLDAKINAEEEAAKAEGDPNALDISGFTRPLKSPAKRVISAEPAQQRYSGPQDQGALSQWAGTAAGQAASGLLDLGGSVMQGIAEDPLGTTVGLIPGVGQYMPKPDQPIDWLYKAGQGAKEAAASGALAPYPGWENSWTATISRALGSTLPLAAASVVTGGGALAMGGTAILSSYAALDEQVQEAIRNGATEEQIKQASRLGSIGGYTEPIPIEMIFNRIPLPGLAKGALGIAGRILEKIAAEGGQEALQTAIQNFSERYVYNPNQDLTEGLAQAFAVGGIVGGGFAGAVELGGGDHTAAPGTTPPPGGTPGTPPPGGTPPPPGGTPAGPLTPPAPGAAPAAPSTTGPTTGMDYDPLAPLPDEEAPPPETPPPGPPPTGAVIPPAAPAGAPAAAAPAPGVAPAPVPRTPPTPPETQGELPLGATPPTEPAQGEFPYLSPPPATLEDMVKRAHGLGKAGGAPEVAPRPDAWLHDRPEWEGKAPLTQPAVAPDAHDITPYTKPIGTRSHPQAPQFAGAQVNEKASDAQREARNAKIGHYRWQPGVNVGIEVAAAGERRSMALPGVEQWSAKLPEGVAYGRIKGTRTRRTEIKTYIGPHTGSPHVFVIDQVDPNSGSFDEPKVMLDFATLEDAKAAYQSSYTDGRGAERMGSITQISTPDFKKWLASKRTARPFDRKATADARRLIQAKTAERRVTEEKQRKEAAATAASEKAKAEISKATEKLTDEEKANIEDEIPGVLPTADRSADTSPDAAVADQAGPGGENLPGDRAQPGAPGEARGVGPEGGPAAGAEEIRPTSEPGGPETKPVEGVTQAPVVQPAPDQPDFFTSMTKPVEKSDAEAVRGDTGQAQQKDELRPGAEPRGSNIQQQAQGAPSDGKQRPGAVAQAAKPEKVAKPKPAPKPAPEEKEELSNEPLPPGPNKPNYTHLGRWKHFLKRALGGQAKAYLLEQGKAKRVEVFLAFDAKGNVLAHGHGIKDRVSLPKSLTDAMDDPANSIALHHNHPWPLSLSAPDIAQVAAPGVHSIWAHGPDGNSSRASAGPNLKKLLGPALPLAWKLKLHNYVRQLEKDFHHAFMAAISRGSTTIDEGNLYYAHVVNMTLHDIGLINYESGIDAKAFLAKTGLGSYMDTIIRTKQAGLNVKPRKDNYANRSPTPLRHKGDLGTTFKVAAGASKQRGTTNLADKASPGNAGGQKSAKPGKSATTSSINAEERFKAPSGTVEGPNAEYEEVLADVGKVDTAWSQDKDMYVGPGGKGQIKTRYPDFGTWLKENPDAQIEMPIVGLDYRGRPSFGNGRHRFAYLRDRGVKQIPMVVNKELAAEFRERYGAETNTLEAGIGLSRRPPIPPDPLATFARPEEKIILSRLMGKIGRPGINWSAFERGIAYTGEATRRLDKALAATGAATGPGIEETMLAHSGRATARGDYVEKQFAKPIMARLRRVQKAIGRTGSTFKDFDKYLIAKHALERNPFLRSRGSTVPDPSGISDADARAIVAGAHPEFQHIAQDVWKLTRETLKLQLDSGLISQEVYDQLANRYQYYVPLQGWEVAEGDEMIPTGAGFDVRGPEFHAATGRMSMADSPLAYALLNANAATARAEKNRLLQVLHRRVLQFRNKAFWEVNRAVKERYWYEDPATGTREIRERWVPPQTLARTKQGLENTIVVKERGVPHYITIHDVPLLKAFRGTNTKEQMLLLRWMSASMRLMGKTLTTYNPIFVFYRNFIRDLQTAMISMGKENIPGLRWAVFKRMLTSSKGMHQYLSGKPRPPGPATTALQFAHDYAMDGGMVGWMDTKTIEQQKKRLQSIIEGNEAMRIARGVNDWIETMNSSVENAIRLALYTELRENHGYARQKAAIAGKEVTTNFNRKGEWSQAINSAYIFFNARVQGTFNVARALRDPRAHKLRLAAYGIIPALGMLTSLFNRLAGGDDDDGLNKWDNIPQYEKEKNFILLNPFGGGYLKIPMTYGYNFFFNIGAETEAMMANIGGYGGKGTEPLTAIGNIIHSATNATSPLDMVRAGWAGVVPTLLAPFYEMGENLNYQGIPIYPTKYDPKEKDSDLYFRKTNPFWVGLAQEIESLTRYDSRKPAFADWSPESMQHLFSTYVGGGGAMLVDQIGNNAFKLATGRMSEIEYPKDLPVVRELFGATDSRSSRNNMYYKIFEDVSRLHTSIKDNEVSAEQARSRHPLEYSLWSSFDSAEKRLRDERERRKKVDHNASLSSSEKARRVDAIEKRMDDIRESVLKRYGQQLEAQ